MGLVRQGRGLKGVINGVYAGLTDKEIMENVRGGQVTGVVRFRPKEGGGGDSPVLLVFADGALPERVSIGSMSYRVREYIRPPLRCYECQRFGHSAGACRGNQRCMKCGEEHNIKECMAGVPKCSNCGGDHAASFRGCMHFVKARKVETVRDQLKVSYADAVKTVQRGEGARRVSVTRVEGGGQSAPPQALLSLPPDALVFSRESFLAFIVEVLVGAKMASTRSDNIQMVVKSAEQYMGVQQPPEKLHGFMYEKSKNTRPDLSVDSSDMQDHHRDK